MQIVLYAVLTLTQFGWQLGPIITCNVYPAPNGGFTEQCFIQGVPAERPPDAVLLGGPEVVQ